MWQELLYYYVEMTQSSGLCGCGKYMECSEGVMDEKHSGWIYRQLLVVNNLRESRDSSSQKKKE